MEEELYKPQLMLDETETDGHAEPIMDYVISWCIRRADVRCKNEKPILYNYCRQILAKLLKITLTDDVEFHDVKVWKQEQKIDLWVELEVIKNGESAKHAILIEDKFYSELSIHTDNDGIQKNQLEIYKKRFDAYYENEKNEGRDWKLHYALITCIKRTDKKFIRYACAKKHSFETYYMLELLGEIYKNPKETESDIFNEFWFRWLNN